MKSYEFIKECGVIYLSTINEQYPAIRPLGAVIEFENKIYFTVCAPKNVFYQLKANENVQVIAHKQGTMDWLRITANAVETTDVKAKQAMLNARPRLAERFKADDPAFSVFALENKQAIMYSQGKAEEIE